MESSFVSDETFFKKANYTIPLNVFRMSYKTIRMHERSNSKQMLWHAVSSSSIIKTGRR